jgi:hypothetical protein
VTWPTIFANLAGGNQPLALFDAMFNQVAQMVAIPTTASGANTITLTPIGSAPALANYQNFSSMRFVAVANSTAAITAQYQALGFVNVYLSDGLTQAGAGNIIGGQEYVLVFAQFLNGGAGGMFLESAAETAGSTIFVPNVQVFTTSGMSGTYTTPTAGGRLPLYLRIRMVGGGGGGGAGNTNNGSNGGDTSFASWTAIHGSGGAFTPGFGGVGGSGGVNGAGNLITRVGGTDGSATVGSQNSSGLGGGSFFGGAGVNSAVSTGFSGAQINSGSGGSGAPGAGAGGAGEFVEFIIPSPVASYAFTVGAFGAGGAAGGTQGGNGGAARIEVEAYWQ